MNRILFCFVAISGIAPLSAMTLRLDEAKSVMPVLVDVPQDWIKNQLVKENGIIYTLRHENAEMEIRSFIFSDVDMDYIVHAKAARMYARYAYINILLEKEESAGDIKKQTIFWKIRYQNKTYYEKTIILQYQNNVVILSCLAPEDEYQHHRTVFENAVLSLRYDLEKNVEIPEVPENPDKKPETDEKKNDTSDKTEIRKDLLKDIDINDSHEDQINKADKLKKRE